MTCATILKTVLEMSVTASVLALVVMIIRKVAKKALPKSCVFALWIVVIAKLLIPLSIPSPTSFYNVVDLEKAEIMQDLSESDSLTQADIAVDPAIKQPIQQGNTAVQVPDVGNDIVKPQTPEKPTLSQEDAGASDGISNTVNNTNSSLTIEKNAETAHDTKAEIINTAGAVYCVIAVAAIVFVISIYVFTAYRIGKSEAVEDERVLGIMRELKNGEKVKFKLLRGNRSIMIFGILRPTIILPEDHETLSDQELKYLLMHEMEHYYHKDTLWNLLMIVSVCVHWFNPIVWLSYRLFLHDMETACDARVLGKLSNEEKHSFAGVLLTFATRKIKGNTIAIMGFGKNNIKDRLLSIIKFKKTGAIAIAASVLVLVITVAVFATGALNKNEAETVETVSTEITEALTSDTAGESDTEPTETEEASGSETETEETEESESEETKPAETEGESEVVIDVVETEPKPVETSPAVETESETKVETTEAQKTTAAPVVTEPKPEVIPTISYAVSQKPLVDVNEDVIAYLWRRAANKDMANLQGQSPVWVIDNRVDCRVLTTMCGSSGLKIAEDMSGYYNSDFFEENVLYMIYVHTSNDTNVCAVDSVYFDGKELNINLTTEYSVYLGGEMANKEEADWFVCVEINREAFEYAEAFDVSSSQNLVIYDYDYKNYSYSRIASTDFYPHESGVTFGSRGIDNLWNYAENTSDDNNFPIVMIDSFAKYFEYMTDKNANNYIRRYLASCIDKSFFDDNVLIITGDYLPHSGYKVEREIQLIGDTLQVTHKEYHLGGGWQAITEYLFIDSIDRETYNKIKSFNAIEERDEDYYKDNPSEWW